MLSRGQDSTSQVFLFRSPLARSDHVEFAPYCRVARAARRPVRLGSVWDSIGAVPDPDSRQSPIRFRGRPIAAREPAGDPTPVAVRLMGPSAGRRKRGGLFGRGVVGGPNGDGTRGGCGCFGFLARTSREAPPCQWKRGEGVLKLRRVLSRGPAAMEPRVVHCSSFSRDALEGPANESGAYPFAGALVCGITESP